MKNTFKNIFPWVAVLGVLLTSCDSKLDLKPQNQVDASSAVATSGDVKALLVGAYNTLGGEDVLGGNIQRDAELLGDAGEIFWDGTFVAPDEIFRKRLLVNNGQAAETWLDSYRTINICNNVLANVSVVDGPDRARVEGEAKFIRAMVYFELVRIYAKTWLDGSPSSNPGVPLVLMPTTSITDEAKVSRSTVAEVYAQIIKDLSEAETALPAANGFFANKAAAAGILSRVYMMQGRYTEAAAAANRVISSNRYALVPIEEVFDLRPNQPGSNSQEDIFAMQVTDQAGVNSLNTFFASAGFNGRGDIPIEEAHFDLYEPGDLRAELFYEENELPFTAKWLNQFGNVKIIRLAEMFLTRAEANFRAGTSVGAEPLADINRVRARAGLPALDASQLTLDRILRERRVELCFEGHLIHDLKRTGRSVGDLPFSSPRLVFPIPQREMDANSNLSQNQGY